MPSVGLSIWKKGVTISFTVASDMPNIFRVRVRLTLPGNLARKPGLISLRHIGSISRGGPGINIMILPSFSAHQPGAVPLGLGIDLAEGISIACLMLLAGLCLRPDLAKQPRNCC